MNEVYTISLAKDFSKYPGGRFIEDGKYSAERFKKEILLPALEEYATVEIDFEGIAGVGSSFLEETFGGLIRENGFSADEIYKRIILKSRQSRIEEIHSYIDNAEKMKNNPAPKGNKNIPLPEKKDLTEFIHNFFQKTDLPYFQQPHSTHVKIELCLDTEGNVVPTSENKVMFDLDFGFYPKGK